MSERGEQVSASEPLIQESIAPAGSGKRLRLTEVFPETKRLVESLNAWSDASRGVDRRVGQCKPRF